MNTMSEEHFQLMDEKLSRLLVVLTSLSDEEATEVRDFIDVGEYGIATETAFQIIVEENKSITVDAYSLFTELVDKMGLAGTVDLEDLKSHVE